MLAEVALPGRPLLSHNRTPVLADVELFTKKLQAWCSGLCIVYMLCVRISAEAEKLQRQAAVGAGLKDFLRMVFALIGR